MNAAEALPALAPESTLMHKETHEAIDAVAHQLARNDEAVERLAASLRKYPPRFVVTCARGSSDHAATFAKYVFETQLGLVTASASPSTSSIYASRQKLDGALYLAISQSGRSPDIVNHARAARRAGARVIALVNAKESPLAEAAHTVIPLLAGGEHSVAATKSYICSLSAILHLASRWKDEAVLIDALNAVPEQMRAGWVQDWSSLTDGLVETRNMFVVGRGFGLAAAQEAALKFKETCGLHAEGFSAAEVKHGPMTLVGPGFPLLFLTQPDESLAGTLDTAREFHARGARVWVGGADLPPDLPGLLPSAAVRHPACAPLVQMPSFYKAVNALAVKRGRNPDTPPHLNKVTSTV
jgi:glucosamine--fructose-6-phosphate aminotransferase (isomerizing)